MEVKDYPTLSSHGIGLDDVCKGTDQPESPRILSLWLSKALVHDVQLDDIVQSKRFADTCR